MKFWNFKLATLINFLGFLFFFLASLRNRDEIILVLLLLLHVCLRLIKSVKNTSIQQSTNLLFSVFIYLTHFSKLSLINWSSCNMYFMNSVFWKVSEAHSHCRSTNQKLRMKTTYVYVTSKPSDFAVTEPNLTRLRSGLFILSMFLIILFYLIMIICD